MKTIFLGGTCNGSQWRESLIPLITNASCYNPVVPNWTPECQAEEIKQRETSDICLYFITPKMTGVYSIAEAVDDSNKRPEKTVFYFAASDVDDTFSTHQIKSLMQTGKMIRANGGKWCENESELINFLNS